MKTFVDFFLGCAFIQLGKVRGIWFVCYLRLIFLYWYALLNKQTDENEGKEEKEEIEKGLQRFFFPVFCIS